MTGDDLTAAYLEQIAVLVEEEAERTIQSDAFSGSPTSAGYAMKERVKFYRLGRDGLMPDEWRRYEERLDPEYAEYQRLKEKFG